jgi:tetratricopeptide (TPR) repeat protein
VHLALVLVLLVASSARAQPRERPPTARAAQLIQAGEAFLASGDRGSAIAYFRDAISADPFAGRAYEALAEAYRARGSLAEAREVYALGTRRIPDRPSLWIGYARTLQALGAEREADEALRSLLARAPDHAEALAMHAELARRRGAWSEALAAYRAILASGTADSESTAEARRYEAALRRLAEPLDPVSAPRACSGSAVRRALARCR